MRHWISINDNRDDNGYDCSSINLHTSVAQLPRDGEEEEEEDHHEGSLSRGWGATIWRIRSVRVTRVTSLQKKGVERQIIGKGEGRGWVTVGLGLALSRKHDTERSTEFLEPLAIYGNSGANGALHDFPFVSFRFVDERSMALLSPPNGEEEGKGCWGESSLPASPPFISGVEKSCNDCTAPSSSPFLLLLFSFNHSYYFP